MNPNTRTIYTAAASFDLPLPGPVVRAAQVVEAAEQLRARVAAEAAPDLDRLDPKALPRVLDALVAYGRHDERMAAAEQIVTAAQAQLDAPRSVHEREFVPAFRELVDVQAAAFAEALAVLGGNTDPAAATRSAEAAAAWQQLQQAATALDQLRAVREAYAHRAGQAPGHDLFRRHAAMLRIPNKWALYRAMSLNASGPEYWRSALDAGCVITWHEHDEIAADWDRFRATSDASPAAAVAI